MEESLVGPGESAAGQVALLGGRLASDAWSVDLDGVARSCLAASSDGQVSLAEGDYRFQDGSESKASLRVYPLPDWVSKDELSGDLNFPVARLVARNRRRVWLWVAGLQEVYLKVALWGV